MKKPKENLLEKGGAPLELITDLKDITPFERLREGDGLAGG